MSIDLILDIAAFICFVATAIGLNAGRVSLLGVGLACWVLTAII